MTEPRVMPDRALRRRQLRVAALCFTAVAAAYAVAVFVLLTANALQRPSAESVALLAIDELRATLRQHPADEGLKVSLRRLDLEARRNLYTDQSFRRRGTVMLGIGIALVLAGLYALERLARAPPVVPAGTDADTGSGHQAALARRLVAIVGSTLFGVAVLVALRSPPPFDGEAPQPTPAGAPAAGLPPSPGAGALPQPPPLPSTVDVLRQWPSFRGPGGNGVAFCNSAPLQWDGATGDGILWKTALPRPGFNSPIVWDARLFLTGADREAREVFCYNVESGELLWRRAVPAVGAEPVTLPDVTPDTGYAASSAATDGRAVVAIFATGEVIALELDGTVRWQRQLGVPENHYGHASSLQIWEGRVLVQFDHSAEARFLALDMATGRTVWETPRPVGISWASPLMLQAETKPVVVLSADPFVIAYDPRTGAEQWRADCMSGEVGPSPAFGNDLVFAANEYAQLAAIRAEDGRVEWTAEDALPNVASPLVHAGLLFTATSNGTVTCYEAKSGTVFWQHEFEQGFYASPLAVAGRIYLLELTGVMQIFAAKSEYQHVAAPVLGEKCVATPAIAAGRLYMRGDRHLYAVGTSPE